MSITTHITTSAPHYHKFAAGSVLTFSKTAEGIVTVCKMSEYSDSYTHYYQHTTLPQICCGQCVQVSKNAASIVSVRRISEYFDSYTHYYQCTTLPRIRCRQCVDVFKDCCRHRHGVQDVRIGCQNLYIPTHSTTSAPYYYEFAAGSVSTVSKTAVGIVMVRRISE